MKKPNNVSQKGSFKQSIGSQGRKIASVKIRSAISEFKRFLAKDE